MQQPFPTLSLFAALFVAAGVPAQDPTAQDAAAKTRLRVVFVGNADKARALDFRKFLQEQFTRVDLVDRKSCEPKQLEKADVVLLDWGQRDDGVMTWMMDRDKPRRCPLGRREDWRKPTVLLGSAGLNLATAWELKGGFG